MSVVTSTKQINPDDPSLSPYVDESLSSVLHKPHWWKNEIEESVTDDPLRMLYAFIDSQAVGITRIPLTVFLPGTFRSESDEQEIFEFRTIQQSLADIQSRFSLTTKDLARVLHVERPTIYSWLKNESEPREGNRRRLQQIWRLAESWAARSPQPLPKARELLPDGRSFLDLLAEKPLRVEKVEQALDRLAEREGRGEPPTTVARQGSRLTEDERYWNLRFLSGRGK